MLSKGLSSVLSRTPVWKHQFFRAQLSLWSNSYIHTWLLGKTIILTIWTFVGKVMSLLFNTLSRFFIVKVHQEITRWLFPITQKSAEELHSPWLLLESWMVFLHMVAKLSSFQALRAPTSFCEFTGDLRVQVGITSCALQPFLSSSSPYLHVPPFTPRTLASNSINTLTSSCNSVTDLRWFHGWFILVLEWACLLAASPVPVIWRSPPHPTQFWVYIIRCRVLNYLDYFFLFYPLNVSIAEFTHFSFLLASHHCWFNFLNM